MRPHRALLNVMRPHRALLNVMRPHRALLNLAQSHRTLLAGVALRNAAQKLKQVSRRPAAGETGPGLSALYRFCPGDRSAC